MKRQTINGQSEPYKGVLLSLLRADKKMLEAKQNPTRDDLLRLVATNEILRCAERQQAKK